MNVHVPMVSGPSVVPGSTRPTLSTNAPTSFGSPHAAWCMSVIQPREVGSSGMLVCADVSRESSWPVAGLMTACHATTRSWRLQVVTPSACVHDIA